MQIIAQPIMLDMNFKKENMRETVRKAVKV